MTHPPHRVAAAVALSDRGLTAVDVAARLGVPRRTISDWLSGRVPRSGSTVARCERCQSLPHPVDDLPKAYVYLLGIYLGDGYIAPARRDVFKLRITLDAAYPNIIEETAAAMRAVMPPNSVGRIGRSYGDVELYSYSKSWPCLFPQHGPGKKHLRPIVLESWQRRLILASPELLLRGLIHSDGCRFENTGRSWRHPRYRFDNLSTDIRRLFCATCELLGLHWTSAGTRTVYVSRKADVARMDRFIGPKA